jgi:TonB family protein
MNIKLPVFAALLAFASPPAYAQDTAPVPADSVYEQQSVTVPPRPLNVAEFAKALSAKYPAGFQHGGDTPSVHVRFIVDVDGTARDFHIVSSSDSVLHAPALAALSVLRFAPAVVDGRPVRVRAALPIEWQLPAPVSDGAGAQVAPTADNITERPPRMLNARALATAMRREYPASLRGSGRTAQVVVRFRVSPAGIPEEATVLSSTDPEFNAASLSVIRVLRFRPAALDDRPVAVPVELPLQWHP